MVDACLRSLEKRKAGEGDMRAQELQEGRGEGITKSSPCQPLGQQRARVCLLLEVVLQEAQEGSKFVRSSKWHLSGENGGWDFLGSAKPLSRSLRLAWLVIRFYLQRESILPLHPRSLPIHLSPHNFSIAAWASGLFSLSFVNLFSAFINTIPWLFSQLVF